MATIEPYETKAGKRYRVRYLKPDRKPTDKRGFKNKRDAQDWAAENTVKMNTGTWRPISAGKITVNELAKAWLATKTPNVAPKTASGYQDAVRHLETVGTLGDVRVADVDHELIEQWLADMGHHKPNGKKPLAPKTIRNSFGVLSGVMKRAVRDKRIPSNPCEGVELPKVEVAEQIILPPADVAVLAAAAGEYSDVVNALAMSGLRWGELAGLQAQDVNLTTGRIRVNRQITENKGRLVHSLPKHGKRRTVPVMAPLAAILKTRLQGKGREDRLFTTGRGGVLRSGNAQRDWFDSAAAAAGYPELTPHDLRHTFASTAISSGANVKALQQALGHHSAAFTLDQYGHLFPNDLDSFVDNMGALFTRDYGQNMGKDGSRAPE